MPRTRGEIAGRAPASNPPGLARGREAAGLAAPRVVALATPTYFSGVRVAMVSTPFVAVPPPGYGGTELVVGALVEALEKAGHPVTVFATGDSKARDLRAFFPRPVWPPDPYAELLHSRFAVREIQAGDSTSSTPTCPRCSRSPPSSAGR